MKKIYIPALIAAAFFIYYFAGFYNVSALVPQNFLTAYLTKVTKQSSINQHSKSVIPPQLEADKRLLKKGFNIYDSNCVQCHGGPGIRVSDFASGLYPEPPHFPDDIQYSDTGEGEIFWATKNGIKMSGMPAYDNLLDDEGTWAVVKFIIEMQDISREDYLDYRRTLIINF